jgi:hypothetical protein
MKSSFNREKGKSIMENVHEENYRGLTIKIFQDNDAESPEAWKDEGLFLVAYGRNFQVDRGQRELVTIFKEEDFKKDNGYQGRVYADGYGWKSYEEAKEDGLLNKQVRRGKWVAGISEGLAQSIANGGRYEDDSINDEAKDYLKKYHVFGLEAYIHSGVSLSLSRQGNFPDRQWDVSQIGLVFVAKTEVRTRAKAEKLARSLISTWNDYLSGAVYGFHLENKQGEVIDSCWGYYGDYDAKGGLLDEVKATVDKMTSNGTTDEHGQQLMTFAQLREEEKVNV